MFKSFKNGQAKDIEILNINKEGEMKMSFIKFARDAVAVTTCVAGSLLLLPIAGPVGAISTAGAITAVSIGTATSALDNLTEED